jgi:FlaA1/EpsC-like NDP-sugar epimerase
MITISTDKAFSPTTVMGATKLIAERMTLNAGYSCVRFGNVANSRGSVIPVYIEDLLNSNPLYVRDPDVTRFIMRISDAVKLIIEATDKLGKEIYILPMPAFKLGDLVDVMVNKIAPKLKVKARVENGQLLPYEKLHESLSESISSEHAKMLTKDELEQIVNEYLKERLGTL